MQKITALLLLSIVLLATPLALAQEAVTVTGTVAPKTTDYEFVFATTETATAFPQNTLLTYEITYGAKASAGFTTPVTLVADWSEGKSSDGTYVVAFSSAGNAYATTQPVVDLSNHTITWYIPSLPAGTTNHCKNGPG